MSLRRVKASLFPSDKFSHRRWCRHVGIQAIDDLVDGAIGILCSSDP